MKAYDPSQNLHIDLKKASSIWTANRPSASCAGDTTTITPYSTPTAMKAVRISKFLKGAGRSGAADQERDLRSARLQRPCSRGTVKTDQRRRAAVDGHDRPCRSTTAAFSSLHCPASRRKMSTAGTSVQYSFFFPYYDQTLELVNKYFNPYEEPISSWTSSADRIPLPTRAAM